MTCEVAPGWVSTSIPWPVTVNVCAVSLTFFNMSVVPCFTLIVEGMNANSLPGPSIAVFVFEPGIPYEGDGVGDVVGLGVGEGLGFSEADALLPHAAATSPRATMPNRRNRRW